MSPIDWGTGFLFWNCVKYLVRTFTKIPLKEIKHYTDSDLLEKQGILELNYLYCIEYHFLGYIMYLVPGDLLRKFQTFSASNRSANGRHIETLAYLIGHELDGNLIGTHLVFPEQVCIVNSWMHAWQLWKVCDPTHMHVS